MCSQKLKNSVDTVGETVSIALASFNGSDYLKEQLESFLTQSQLPDEVVICDDGSTDDTIKIILDFQDRAPFNVRLCQNTQNLGHVQNFSKALSCCSGDIIFLSDQDDKWWPEKISTLTRELQANPMCWMIIHDGEIADAQLSSTGMSKMSQVHGGYGEVHTISTGALSVLRRDLLQYAIPIPKNVTAHDSWLHAVASLMPRRRIVFKKKLQYIRRHAENTSSWVVNDRKKISRFDVMRAQFQSSPSISYKDRIAFNFHLRRRLHKLVHSVGSPIEKDELLIIKNKLELEMKSLITRQYLVKSRSCCRRILAVQMLIKGQYSFFNGASSFIRDILR